jgi:hypothetical protein
MELVGDARIEDETPPRRRGLVHRTQVLDEQRERSVVRHHLHDTPPGPGSKLGPKGDLGSIISFLVQRWRLVMGCDLFSCLGLCEKAMSCFCINRFVGRSAAAHFGQRNAGSPLNALMRSIQRFLAQRAPPPRPVHTPRQPAPDLPSPLAPVEPPVRRGLHPSALHSTVGSTMRSTPPRPHPTHPVRA